MPCLSCKQGSRVSDAIKRLTLSGEILAMALDRAARCDKCDYCGKDLVCRAKQKGLRFIPGAIRHADQHCPFGLW